MYKHLLLIACGLVMALCRPTFADNTAVSVTVQDTTHFSSAPTANITLTAVSGMNCEAYGRAKPGSADISFTVSSNQSGSNVTIEYTGNVGGVSYVLKDFSSDTTITTGTAVSIGSTAGTTKSYYLFVSSANVCTAPQAASSSNITFTLASS